jgi:hypothetical protein
MKTKKVIRYANVYKDGTLGPTRRNKIEQEPIISDHNPVIAVCKLTGTYEVPKRKVLKHVTMYIPIYMNSRGNLDFGSTYPTREIAEKFQAGDCIAIKKVVLSCVVEE